MIYTTEVIFTYQMVQQMAEMMTYEEKVSYASLLKGKTDEEKAKIKQIFELD